MQVSCSSILPKKRNLYKILFCINMVLLRSINTYNVLYLSRQLYGFSLVVCCCCRDVVPALSQTARMRYCSHAPLRWRCRNAERQSDRRHTNTQAQTTDRTTYNKKYIKRTTERHRSKKSRIYLLLWRTLCCHTEKPQLKLMSHSIISVHKHFILLRPSTGRRVKKKKTKNKKQVEAATEVENAYISLACDKAWK